MSIRGSWFTNEPKTKVPKLNYELEGYVIIPPLSPWNKENVDKIITQMAHGTFGTTSALSWAKHTQVQPYSPEFSSRVQYWHDRGYRLKTAKLIIDMGDE